MKRTHRLFHPTWNATFSPIIYSFFLLVILATSPLRAADESDAELAKKTQNPVADLISVPFQNNFNFNYGPNNVVPIGLAITLLKRPVTGSWTGGGSTVAQVMATDSTTNEVIAAAQDKYEAGFFERFSSTVKPRTLSSIGESGLQNLWMTPKQRNRFGGKGEERK